VEIHRRIGIGGILIDWSMVGRDIDTRASLSHPSPPPPPPSSSVSIPSPSVHHLASSSIILIVVHHSHHRTQEGFATIITNEFANAGFETLMLVVGERMFNTTDSQHLPPINVTFEHPFMSSMVKITPSPDWYVGFSDFRTISYDTETFYNRFVIQSYVWDSGTDGGQSYTALDRDLDPQLPNYRFCARTIGETSTRRCPDLKLGRIETPARDQFLDYSGTYIPTPAEYECVLRVGDGQIYPGVEFNETQIRPPMYVPRPDDDFVMGVSPHDPEFETKTGQRNPADAIASGGGPSTPSMTASAAALWLMLGTMMLAIATGVGAVAGLA
jgi:Spondin_N